MEDTTWLIYLSNKLYHMYMTRVIYLGATTGLECFLPVPASYLTRLQYCLCTARPQPPSVTYSRSQDCSTLDWTAEKYQIINIVREGVQKGTTKILL